MGCPTGIAIGGVTGTATGGNVPAPTGVVNGGGVTMAAGVTGPEAAAGGAAEMTGPLGTIKIAWQTEQRIGFPIN